MATKASFTVSVDTTGLSGETLALYAIGTLHIDFFGTGNVCSANLKMNGVTVLSQSQSGTNSPIIVLSWNITFTGTGGIVNIPVLIEGNVAASSFTCEGSLFAIACKR
jgi:hypothetical protein